MSTQMEQTAHKPGLRMPPQNLEAEKALLGSIMLRPESMHEVLDVVNAGSFYSSRHHLIFKTMFELFQKNIPIDFVSMSSRLSETGQIEQVGGASYLAELVQHVPSAANVKFYADVVRNKHLMRSLIDASEFIAHLGYDEATEIDLLLDKAEKKIYDVTNYNSTNTFIELKDTLGEAWEQIERLHTTKGELRGVPTGFKELDNKLSGFQKSDLIILAARPSMGKTSLALDMARRAAITHGKSIGVFSLEMSSQQLVGRMLSAESGIDAWKLRTGHNLQDDDFPRIREAMDRLSKAPIFIDDQAGNNILKMRSVARRLKKEKGLDLIIVDYLQLMVPTQARGNDSMVQQVTEISRSLKNLARELDVPVLALSQLSREVEKRGGEPRLSDLRDSGSIEQDADVVMFIHREDKYNKDSARPNVAKIMIEKHRNGATGFIELFFDANKTKFDSIEKSDFGGFAGSDDNMSGF